MSQPTIDKRRARRAFEAAAAGYDLAAVLQREIADRLLERLDYVRLEPRRILDLGCGTGYAVQPLHRRYRRAEVVALDFALPMLQQARRRGSWLRRPHCLCADAESLPLAEGSVDLILSNATLQWCNDLNGTFRECLRVLRPGGLLMFTTFGPDTLKELRAAWSEVDGHSHVSPFPDMHDLGDALVRTRFADPVMDAERLTVTYARLADLMADLKSLGAHNATDRRPRGLTAPRRLAALEAAYEVYRSDGRLPATYEVVFGHAWAPEQKPAEDGVAIPLEAIRGALGRPRQPTTDPGPRQTPRRA
jgi:malonyl-CoA O-methyltransferase